MKSQLHNPSLLSVRARRPLVLASIVTCALITHARADILNFTLTLDGPQETPGVTTPATGSGTATFDTDTNLFSWNVQFSGLVTAQTGAHFHGPAPLCEPAGIQIPLPLGSPLIGSMNISAQQASDLLSGLWYLNIHSSAHPTGEIRGQVMPAPLSDPIEPGITPGTVHIELKEVTTGLTAPNWGTSAPGDASHLFVTDQDGILWKLNLADGSKTVFLDVSPLLVDLGVFGPGSFDERGLLGVAFHPDYQSNGLLYTYTSEPVFKPADFSTMPPGVLPHHRSVIREWEVPNPGDQDSVVDPTTSRALMRVDQPQFNHNAGAMSFGPDDLLYVAFGDGGGADDKDGQQSFGSPIVGHGCIGNGQDTNTILGSIIRIDPLGNNSANGQYGIPGDNPFVGDDGLDEIYAYGFRNPFRFSFDQDTGELWLADVGQNDIEEINTVQAGGNYGWNLKEGSFFFNPNGNGPGSVTDLPLNVPGGLIDPIAQYDHDEGIAIVGGFVYRGGKFPQLQGRYIFAEFAVNFNNDGRLFYLDRNDEIREFPLVGQRQLGLSVLGMAQDANGEVYLLANSTGVPFDTTGVVLKLALRDGDTNADGLVDVFDLLSILDAFGQCALPCPPNCPQDINNDCSVDVFDLLAVLDNFTV